MPKPFVVGIAGGSASGKSTFSKDLANMLEGCKIATFHMDNYFKPQDNRPRAIAPITKKVYMDDNHPTTVDLPQLRLDMTAAIAEEGLDIIIVEGLLTLHDDEICKLLDLKLYIECRADERMARRLRRNMQRGLTFDEIADVYLDIVRYRHDEYVEVSKWRADIILNGSMFSERALRIIAKAVRGGWCG